MTTKYTKLNYRFGIIEYPVTLKEMEQISLEFPKMERKFYEFAIKDLEKILKEDEKIYSFTSADPKLTKTGFLVITDKQLVLVSMKGGMFGGAESEAIQYKDITEVDFDIAPDVFGAAQMELGILYLTVKGTFASKKRTIRNIPKNSLDRIVTLVKDISNGEIPTGIETPSEINIEDPVTVIPSVADELRKLASLRDEGILTDDEFLEQKQKLLK